MRGLTATQRRVLEAALTWRGTKYVAQGDARGVGVDCVMFVVRVYQAAGVFPADMPDPRPYPSGWCLERGSTRYGDAVATYLLELGADRLPEPADLMLFRVGRAAAHGAIVLEWPRVIHADADEGAVLEAVVKGGALDGRPRVGLYRPRAPESHG